MKNTKAINLASRVFLLDENAFESFSVYHDMIKTHFQRYQNAEKKIEDMDFLIADFLDECRKSDDDSISNEDVKKMIQEFGYSDAWDKQYADSENQQAKEDDKRFYLDSENKLIGGVCSGIAIYFKLDLSLVRILTVLFCILFAPLFLFYIILWIVAPNHEQVLNEKHFRSTKTNHSSSNALKHVGKATGTFISKFFGVILLIISVSIIISLLVGIGAFLDQQGMEFLEIPFLTERSQQIFIAASVIALVFPFLFLSLLAVRLLSERSFPQYTWLSMFLLWLASLTFLSVKTVRLFNDFDYDSSITKRYTLNQKDSKHIIINSNFSRKVKRYEFLRPEIKLISSSRYDSVLIKMHCSASGASRKESKEFAKSISFTPKIDGNKIEIPDRIPLADDELFHYQQVALDIYIPEGSNVNVKNFNRYYIELENRRYSSEEKNYLPKFKDILYLRASENGFVIKSL